MPHRPHRKEFMITEKDSGYRNISDRKTKSEGSNECVVCKASSCICDILGTHRCAKCGGHITPYTLNVTTQPSYNFGHKFFHEECLTNKTTLVPCDICWKLMSPYDSCGNYGTHRHLECMFMPRILRNCRCCGNLITPYSESPNRTYCSGSCKEEHEK